MMVAIVSSETSALARATRLNIPEDGIRLEIFLIMVEPILAFEAVLHHFTQISLLVVSSVLTEHTACGKTKDIRAVKLCAQAANCWISYVQRALPGININAHVRPSVRALRDQADPSHNVDIT
jgi:hypothetical protein